MPITYRLYEPKDLEPTVQLVQRVFYGIAPIPLETWAKIEAQDHITVLAEDGRRVVGAIPFAIRDFLIRPGVSIRGAFAHLVGVDEAYRKRGVGSGIMGLAKEALPDVCDAVFVYTGGEGHAPYTFYERNSFIDLHYSRFYILSNPRADAPGEVKIELLLPTALDETALNEAYQRVYREYAGFPPRSLGYWKEALDSIIYVEIPGDFYLASVSRGSRLDGYAIFAYSEGSVVVLEMVADPQEKALAENLLKGIIAAAAAHGAPIVRMVATCHHPAVPALTKLGFQPMKRAHANITAGQVFHFDKLWPKLSGGDSGMALCVWTPERELTLPGEGPVVSLEMKATTLHRLFLCREDVQAAFLTERITSTTYPLPLDRLQRIFQPAPWVHHWLEWI